MLHSVVDGVVKHPQLQRRLLIIRVNHNKIPLRVQHAAALVVAQPPYRGGLGFDLLPVFVHLRRRVLSRRNPELGHGEGAVPGKGNLLGIRIEKGKKSVAVDGEIKVPPGIGEAPAGEINGSMDHSCAGALRQPGVVNAVHIPVHQLAERSPLRTIALGVDIGNILGLNVHAQLLLIGAHGGIVKRHIHLLRTFLSSVRACGPLSITFDPIPSYL